jgi:hypothetical protein
LEHNRTRTVTYNHASDTKKATAYETSRIAYSTLEDVRPAEFRHNTRGYVPKRDDPLRCRGRHEIKSGGKDDHI